MAETAVRDSDEGSAWKEMPGRGLISKTFPTGIASKRPLTSWLGNVQHSADCALEILQLPLGLDGHGLSRRDVVANKVELHGDGGGIKILRW